MRVRTIAAVVMLVAAIVPAHAEVKNVKISLDWVIQGTHAPFFVAQDKGYFKAEGITVDAIDKGNGATNVAVTVASGAYQYGWVDMPSMILFNAKNPSTPLIAVYVSFDQTPLAFITRKAAGIRTPADLDGKKIAGGPGIAVHDTASILFNDLFVLKYSDFGADMYGLALVTRKKFADENPQTTRAVVKALNQGTRDTIAAPQKALDLLKARDPMMKMEIEKIRLDLALGLTNTPHVANAGLSSVTPEKLAKTIDAVVAAYGLTSTPAAESVYTDRYLPSAAERVVSKGAN
jgi:NitT/TauT family transport system substrate-binding protein